MSGLLSCFSSKGSCEDCKSPSKISSKERNSGKERDSTRSQDSVARGSGRRSKERKDSKGAQDLKEEARRGVAGSKRQVSEDVARPSTGTAKGSDLRPAEARNGDASGTARSNSAPNDPGSGKLLPSSLIPSSKSHDVRTRPASSWRTDLVDTADDSQVRAVPLQAGAIPADRAEMSQQVVGVLAPPSPWAQGASASETDLLSGSSDTRAFDSDAREYIPTGLQQEHIPVASAVHTPTSDSAESLKAGNERQSGSAGSDKSQGDSLIQFPADLGRRSTINLRGVPKQSFTDADEDQIATTMQRFEEIGSYRIPLRNIRLKCKNGRPVVLGTGGFGKVFYGSLYREDCAIKVVLEGTRKEQARFLNEIKILERLKTSTITRFMGYSVTPEGLLLVMEYVAGGTLTKSLEESDRHQWYNGGKQVMMTVAVALCVLSSQRIAHLDLKSPNILIGANGEAKVADVGLGKLMKGEVSLVSRVGTLAWAPPEQLMGKVGTFSDIWSAGTLLWEVVTREKPPTNRHLREIEVPEEAPQEVVDLIDLCHHQNWQQRIDAEKLHTLLEACPQ